MTVSGLVAYLSLLNLGIVQTTAVRFATAVARGDRDQASRFLATGFWSYVKLASAALVCLIAIGPWLPWVLFVKGPPALQHRVTTVLMAAAAGFLVELPLGVFGACLRAIGRVDRQQGVGVLQNVARVVAAVLVLRAGGELPILIALLATVNVLSCALQYACLRREIPGLNVSPRRWDITSAREMSSPSRYYFVLQIAGAVTFGSDTVIISSLLGTNLVAPYAIAQRLVSVGLAVVSTISANFAPSFLDAYARADVGTLRARFGRSTRVSVLIGVAMSGALLAAGPAFIRLWVGPNNFVGYPPFLGIVGLMLVQMVLLPCDQLLVSTARHKEYALAAAWEAAVSLGGSLIVAPLWGVAGVAWVRLIGRLIGAGPVMIWRTAAILSGR
jgi:O-antigen/teichoic acid export membrane protein